MTKIVAARFSVGDERSILFVGGIRGGRGEFGVVLRTVEDWCSREGVNTLVMFLSSGVAPIFEAEIRKKKRSLNIWTVVSDFGKAPTLSRGSGADYEMVKMKNFGKSNTEVISQLKSNLSISSIAEYERSVGFAPKPEEMDFFLEDSENYFDQTFTNKRYILGFSKGNGGIFFRTLGTLNKAVSGRYRAICEVLEGFLGEGKLRGSVLVGVVGYWDELVSGGPSKVDDALNGANSVALNEVFKKAVRWRAGVGGGGGTMQNRRHGAMAEEGDEVEVADDGEEEVVEEDDRKGKGLGCEEKKLDGVKRVATRAMAKMRMDASGAGAELDEEEREEGSSEDDLEEVGWVGEARGGPRFCFLRFDGTDPGSPSEKMKEFVRQEQACEALVVLGFRTLEGLDEEEKIAWLGIEGVMVVERRDGRLYFNGECRQSLDVRGGVLFFGSDDLIEWIVGEACGFLDKSERVRDRWISSILKFMDKVDWPIEGLEQWAYVRFGAGAPGEARDMSELDSE